MKSKVSMDKHRRKAFINGSASKTKIRNRCTITGRSRAVFRKFKLARLELKRALELGLVPGFKKYLWPG